jgi:hypothetical protein
VVEFYTHFISLLLPVYGLLDTPQVIHVPSIVLGGILDHLRSEKHLVNDDLFPSQ